MFKTTTKASPTLLLLQDHGELSSLHAALMSYVTSTLAIIYQLEKLLQNLYQLAFLFVRRV